MDFWLNAGLAFFLLKCGPRVELKYDHRVLLKRGPHILRQTEHMPRILELLKRESRI